MDCFNAVKLNESVISYINRCDIDLDFSKTEYNEDTKGRLFDSVIICNDIDNSKYKQILVSLKFIYVIKHLAPNSIDYDIKENKYVEHRIVKTNGKTYETTGEYKITTKENDDGSREVTEMKLPDGHTIKFEGFDI